MTDIYSLLHDLSSRAARKRLLQPPARAQRVCCLWEVNEEPMWTQGVYCNLCAKFLLG